MLADIDYALPTDQAALDAIREKNNRFIYNEA